MKRFLILFALLLSLLLCAACANKATVSATEPTAEATAAPTAAPTPEPTATPAPTPEPTPSPTPEPPLHAVELTQELFSRRGVTLSVTGLRYGLQRIEVDLVASNETVFDMRAVVKNTYANDFLLNAAESGEETIPAGADGHAFTIVLFDAASETYAALTPYAEWIGMDGVRNLALDILLENATTGDLEAEYDAIALTNPSIEEAASPLEALTCVFEDNNLAVYPLSINGALTDLDVVVLRKEGSRWTKVTIDPVYGGFTNMLNDTYAFDAGKCMLLHLDGTTVAAQYGIEKLADMTLYLTLIFGDGRIDRPVIAKISDPDCAETVVTKGELTAPIVYQSELAYCILRYSGIVKYGGHDAVLLDYENITQNYIKLLDLTAYSARKSIYLDGVPYDAGVHCTYSFPNTHGSILIWPDGAPEGTLQNAEEIKFVLSIARIHAGHLDPIVGTGDVVFKLK